MGRKAIICLLMVVVFVFHNFAFVSGQNIHEIAEANGYTTGEIFGEIAGQKDYINNHRSDWQKAYQEEEKRIIALYELEKETQLYNFYFLKGFSEGFKEGYERVHKGFTGQGNITEYDLGTVHGKFFGALLGNINGVKEFHEGKTNDWRRTVPTDSGITREYSLSKDTARYRNGFIIGFKQAYEEAYTHAFRNANVDNHRVTKEMGIIHGKEVGVKQGEIYGQMDFVDGKNNDWKSALPREQKIILQANLLRENPQYRDGFLAGFKEGFKWGYTEAFRKSNTSNTLDNIKYTKVSMLGATIKSPDEMLTLTIKPGSFYWESFLSLEKDVSPIYTLNTRRLEAVTNRYDIGVANHIGYVDLKEPVVLEFKYYGPERAGIYRLVNGEWQYLYSRLDRNSISTMIPAGIYTGGTYAVFIDGQYPELKDIYTHWASEEIYTFVRRFYVAGYTDGTVRPTEYVSRGEFVTLLNRVLKWTATSSSANIQFVDEGEFGVHKSAIQNAVAKGYIKGYPDNTFRAKNPITYQEIEWIMERIVRNKDFKWEDIEERMLYEKYTRSESRHSMRNNITRGEIIYMLHELQKDRKL